MKQFLSAILVFALTTTAVWAQSPAEMEQDARKIHGLYTEVMAIDDPRLPENGTGNSIGENAPAYAKALKDTLALTRLKEQHGAFLNEFRQRYAPGEQDYAVSRVLHEKFEPLALGYEVGYEFGEIAARFDWLDGLGQKNALSCLAQIRLEGADPGYLKVLHEMFRVKAIAEARQLLDICPRFDPGNELIQRRVEELRPQVEATLAKYQAEEMKALAGRKWPGGTPNPAGLQFLRSLPDWGGNTERGTKILQVVVSGNWFVAERNLLGQPTHYGLPVIAAVRDNTMPAGVVTLYDLSLITTGPQKSNDFERVWVGEVWRMLAKNMPG